MENELVKLLPQLIVAIKTGSEYGKELASRYILFDIIKSITLIVCIVAFLIFLILVFKKIKLFIEKKSEDEDRMSILRVFVFAYSVITLIFISQLFTYIYLVLQAIFVPELRLVQLIQILIK